MKLVRKNKKSEKICKITQIIQYSANFEQNASWYRTFIDLKLQMLLIKKITLRKIGVEWIKKI
jgi:hypothetical protein